MAKNWDYAVLSKLANEAGGPQKMMNSIIETSSRQGRITMIPWMALTAICGGVSALALEKLISYFKNKNENEIEADREELINGIESYIEEHPESDTKN